MKRKKERRGKGSKKGKNVVRLIVEKYKERKKAHENKGKTGKEGGGGRIGSEQERRMGRQGKNVLRLKVKNK